MELSRIWIALLTRDAEDAGTNEYITLTINTRGSVRINRTVPYSVETGRTGPRFEDQPYLDRKEANLYHLPVGGTNIIPEDLSLRSSSIRMGILGDNAWSPEHIFIWGETAHSRAVFPIAIETDIEPWLSTDSSEGPELLNLRTVGKGGNDMPINRLLLLTLTEGTTESDFFTTPNPYFGTDDPFAIEIRRGGELVVSHEIADTPQMDLDSGYANFYFLPVRNTFSKGELAAESIVFSLKGQDEWVPRKLFLFGLDTAQGRPLNMVPLVHLDYWPFGVMRPDPGTDIASSFLPLFFDCVEQNTGNDLVEKVDSLIEGQKMIIAAIQKICSDPVGRVRGSSGSL